MEKPLVVVIDPSESSEMSSSAEPLKNSIVKSPSKTVSVTANKEDSRPVIQVPNFTVSKANEYSVQTVDSSVDDSYHVVLSKKSEKNSPVFARMSSNGSRYTVSEFDPDEEGISIKKFDKITDFESKIVCLTVRSKMLNCRDEPNIEKIFKALFVSFF